MTNIESSRSACWPTRLFMRNSPFTFAPWLPFLFHHAHWDQTEESLCPSLGSRPTMAQGPSAHVPLLFGTTFHYLSVQPPRLPSSEDVSKHTFSTWPFPRRHRCALLPVNVTERLQRLRIWTPIWLLRHWAWLRRGYWRYRNLIDWFFGLGTGTCSLVQYHLIHMLHNHGSFEHCSWNVLGAQLDAPLSYHRWPSVTTEDLMDTMFRLVVVLISNHLTSF